MGPPTAKWPRGEAACDASLPLSMKLRLLGRSKQQRIVVRIPNAIKFQIDV